jgi:ribonuclease E
MSDQTLPEMSGANPPSTPAEPSVGAPARPVSSAPNAAPPAASVADAPSVAASNGTAETVASDKADPTPADPTTLASPVAAGSGTRLDAAASPDGTARRRRRGSRGGRNRNRPRSTGSATTGEPSDSSSDASSGSPFDAPSGQATEAVSNRDATGRGQRGHDWNDADADGGYTDDDALTEARTEAGLPTAAPQIGDRRPAPPRPNIGDRRPSPTPTSATGSAPEAREGDAETGPKKRRRRRGGRGRSRGSAPVSAGENGSGRTGNANRPTPTYIEGSLAADDGDGEANVLDLLDDEMLEKRRGLTRKGRPTGRYAMVVRTKPNGVSQIAVLEGRNLIEHYVSEPEDEIWSIDGNIYLGRVQNVLPGMEAAFIDIGTPKNGVLYQGDVAFDESDVDGGEKPRIERVLHNGQAIIVQVTKNPIGHKGARLTQEVSLAGRFVVMVPGQAQTYGISKRLPDDERKRLRRILDHLRPDDAGLIVRTAAEGATEEELERDMRRLRNQWAQISALAKQSKTGRLLYKEPPLVTRVIREEFTKEYRAIVIDDRALFDEVKGYVEAVAPELADRVEYYDKDVEPLPVFERFHVHEQLHKALDRKVWLPSGGSLVIERTEALTVIDVNTGKNVGRTNLEETVYRNNLEAADAVARELRLRDIGGIIVIDFIDMEIKKNREDVERAFREALARDKTRTQVFPITELGLLEMTRKRVSEGLVEAFSETCETCAGRGFVLDESMLE